MVPAPLALHENMSGVTSLARRDRPPAPRRPAGPFGSSIRLFSVAGIDIAVHASWILIAILVTWSLATGVFPATVPGASTATYWLLGAVTALLFFASVLAHELAHSLVARSRGVEVSSITLFLFGGVSNLTAEARAPGEEFQIAIVGPLTSFAIALLAFLVALAVRGNTAAQAIAGYLAFINAALGVFNLVPGFPLDGGRVLRSVLWRTLHDLSRATRIATTIGQLVAWAMIASGVWLVLTGDIIGGVWTAAIGWFLETAAGSSLQHAVLETRLRRLRVSDVLRQDPSGVTADTAVDDLIDRWVLPGARRAVAVVEDGRIAGLVTLADIARVPPDRRPWTRVWAIMTPGERLVTVAPGTTLQAAIAALGSGEYEQVPVVDGGRFVGLLTRADVLRELQIRDALGLDEKGQIGQTGGAGAPGA